MTVPMILVFMEVLALMESTVLHVIVLMGLRETIVSTTSMIVKVILVRMVENVLMLSTNIFVFVPMDLKVGNH